MEGGIIEDFLRQTPLRSLFNKYNKGSGEDETGTNLIPELSHLANSVVARCSRIIRRSTIELQLKFNEDIPDHLRKPTTYARNLLEYCSYQALQLLTKTPNYLADKKFRRLTYDMMLAWEAPQSNELRTKEDVCHDSPEIEDEDDGSLFYTSTMSMAVQVDHNKTVGSQAFARIASACPAIADPITVHNLFDALSSSTNGQLHFIVYDKYLGSLDKVYRSLKSLSVPSIISGLQLDREEIILDNDGVMPTQPILQHIGISAWPGRLTLTNHALYFEALGVGSYDKAMVYDLVANLKQVIKAGLTGPLGARIFDKAVMYNSNALEEPIYFEFTEFKGHSRRDYWLAIILEITYVNRFIRKYDLKGIQKAEAFSKAIIGILQYRAVKEAFRIMPSHFKTLLSFSLAEELPKGDEILYALYNHLENLCTSSEKNNQKTQSYGKIDRGYLPVSLQTLTRLGFSLLKDTKVIEQRDFLISDVFVGDFSPLEMAVKESRCYTGLAEAAQATVEQVKVEGIDTNVAVMKELIFPVIELLERLHFLAAWEDSFKSTSFLVLVLYGVHRGWMRYSLPCIFIFTAMVMLWHKYHNNGVPLKAFRITLSPSRNPVEQLLSLQEAISQFESLIQAGNIILLKIRAILLAALPQATDKVVVLLLTAAIAFALVPLKIFLMLAFLEGFTREMPLRRDVSEKFEKRMREWWIHIPAAPVELIRIEEKKK